MRNKKGFTLIEMLVVIAIIAVLVSIVIPVVGAATTKAEAATDAANLRSVLGVMNSVLITQEMTIEAATASYEAPESKVYPDAELYVLYSYAGFIDVYFVEDGNYYGLDYYSDLAQNGSTEIEPEAPATETGDAWYKVG